MSFSQKATDFLKILSNFFEILTEFFVHEVPTKEARPTFRRTLATRAIDKGMPVEQVQRLLGHSKIETTMEYAMVDQSNVRNSHRRYLS